MCGDNNKEDLFQEGEEVNSTMDETAKLLVDGKITFSDKHFRFDSGTGTSFSKNWRKLTSALVKQMAANKEQFKKSNVMKWMKVWLDEATHLPVGTEEARTALQKEAIKNYRDLRHEKAHSNPAGATNEDQRHSLAVILTESLGFLKEKVAMEVGVAESNKLFDHLEGNTKFYLYVSNQYFEERCRKHGEDTPTQQPSCTPRTCRKTTEEFLNGSLSTPREHVHQHPAPSTSADNR